MTNNYPTHSESDPLLQEDDRSNENLDTFLSPVSSVYRTENIGYLFMLVAALGFGTHALMLRLAGSVYGISAITSLFIRGLMHFIFSTVYFMTAFPLRDLFKPVLGKRQYGLLFCRGLAGTLSLIFYYIGVSNFIPAGDAVAIFFVAPVFTLMLSSLFLYERVHISDIFAMFLSILGAFLIARSSPTEMDLKMTPRFIGAIMMAISALFAAIAYTIIRGLGMSISFMSSVFSLASMTIILAITLGAINTIPTDYDNGNGIPGLTASFFAGIASFIAQVGISLGLQRCRAGPGVLLSNTEVPLSFMLAFIFLHEMPTSLTIFGSILIVSSALIIGTRQLQLQDIEQ